MRAPRRADLRAALAATALACAVALSGCSMPWKAPVDEPGNFSGITGNGTGTGLVNSFGLLGRAQLRTVLGDPNASRLEGWPGVFDIVPTAADIDGDGQDEIIGHSNDTFVYVFRQDGKALARLETGYPPDWYRERVLNGVAVGTLRPGEPRSIVVANGAAFVQAWRFEPGQSTGEAFVFTEQWEKRMDACFGNPGMDAKPVIADADGDGVQEIFVQTEEIGLFALNADGSRRWHYCWAGGNAEPVVADLEDDGKVEAIFASDGGVIAVFDANAGRARWTFAAADPVHGIKPGSVSVAPTVADLDGRMPKEVLFTARYAPEADPEKFDEFHLAIFAVHHDLQTGKSALVWKRQPDWAHPLSHTHLLVQDVDADGAMDIFGMDWNTIGHKPGNWQDLGDSHVFRLNAQGNDVWVVDLDTWWSNKDIALVDSDKDGTPELFVNGAYLGNDGIWRMKVADGERDGFLSAAPWKVMRAPLVADLHHDGTTQLVLPVAPNEVLETRGALLVYDLNMETTS